MNDNKKRELHIADDGMEERIDHELDDNDDGAVWIFFFFLPAQLGR